MCFFGLPNKNTSCSRGNFLGMARSWKVMHQFSCLVLVPDIRGCVMRDVIFFRSSSYCETSLNCSNESIFCWRVMLGTCRHDSKICSAFKSGKYKIHHKERENVDVSCGSASSYFCPPQVYDDLTRDAKRHQIYHAKND